MADKKNQKKNESTKQTEKEISKEIKKDLTSLLDLASAGFIADDAVSDMSGEPSIAIEKDSEPASTKSQTFEPLEIWASEVDANAIKPAETEHEPVPTRTAIDLKNDSPTSAETDDQKESVGIHNEPTAALTQLPEEHIQGIRDFAENLGVSVSAQIEANPPFTLLARGKFNETEKKHIRGIIKDAQIGIEHQDIDPQIDLGKIFIPRISEYAAIFLANKLRDYCDHIQVGLANDVYAGEIADAPEIAKDESDSGFTSENDGL